MSDSYQVWKRVWVPVGAPFTSEIAALREMAHVAIDEGVRTLVAPLLAGDPNGWDADWEDEDDDEGDEDDEEDDEWDLGEPEIFGFPWLCWDPEIDGDDDGDDDEDDDEDDE